MKTAKISFIMTIGWALLTTQIIAKNYVLFSPDDKPAIKLIELINASKKSIYAAVYFLTDKTIAGALINAKNRGVDVQIITDPISAESSFGKATLLAQNNVTLYLFNNGRKAQKPSTQDQRFSYLPIMHNKFALFDDVMLWTGSFNWTQAANAKNSENVIYTDDSETCKKYKTYWHSLTTQKCSRYLTQQNRSSGRSIKPLHCKRQAAQGVRARRHMAKA